MCNIWKYQTRNTLQVSDYEKLPQTLQEIKFGRIDIEIGRTLLYGFNVYITAIKTIDALEKVDNQNNNSELTKEEKEELQRIRQRVFNGKTIL